MQNPFFRARSYSKKVRLADLLTPLAQFVRQFGVKWAPRRPSWELRGLMDEIFRAKVAHRDVFGGRMGAKRGTGAHKFDL